jgi:hypothetical protein
MQGSDGALNALLQVPYSLHCNYSELRSFIAALRPRQVLPTVTHGVEAEVSVGLNQLCCDLVDSTSSKACGVSGSAQPSLLQR